MTNRRNHSTDDVRQGRRVFGVPTSLVVAMALAICTLFAAGVMLG